jgi:hypothetical protein
MIFFPCPHLGKSFASGIPGRAKNVPANRRETDLLPVQTCVISLDDNVFLTSDV